MNALLLALALSAAWRPDAPKTHEIDLPRFRIHATDKALGTSHLLAAELEQDRDFVAGRLGGDYPGLTEVRLGEGVEEVLRLQIPQEGVPSWAAGMALPEENLILLEAGALRREGGVGIVRHELAHLAIAQLGSPRMPRWFQEGLAMRAAGESSPEAMLSLVRAARAPIPLRELEVGFPEGYGDVQLAYAESQDFVDELFVKYGAAKVRALLAAVHAGKPFDASFAAIFGPPEAVESAWLQSLRLRYTWIPLVTGSSTLFALMALTCVLAWTRVRRRKRRLLSELALEEQALHAAERIRAAEDNLPEATPVELEAEPPPAKPTLH